MKTARSETIREQLTHSRNKRVVGAGALLLTTVGLVAGCAPSKSVHASSQSPVAERSTSTPYSQPTTSSSPETSPSTVPSTAPSKTPETSASRLTLEQLFTMKPLLVPYDPAQPYGSVEAIQTIYKDIQLAAMSGRVDFLSAAMGANNMTSDFAAKYLGLITKFQTYFQANPAQRLEYRYTATDIRQTSPDSRTYNLISTEKIGDQVLKSAQTILLSTDTDNSSSSSSHWILLNVIQSVPVS